MKRKAVVIILSAIVVVALALYAVLFALGTQRRVVVERADTIVASLPIVSSQPLRVKVIGDVEFRIDSGSDISCITDADLEHLREMGIAISERTLPAFGRSADGHIHAWTKRTVIDLPLQFFTSHPDVDTVSVIQNRLAERDNKVLGMEFVVIPDSIGDSAFGVDFLGKFVVEYMENDRLIRLHTRRPEGYRDFTTLHTSYFPTHSPWPGERYYVELSVDHLSNLYFMDTGLQRAPVKLPADHAGRYRERMAHDSIVSLLGVFDAVTAETWVECGDRAGTKTAFYSDNDEEPFSFNPITLYSQDLIIDFPNRAIALRPYAVKRHLSALTDSIHN